MAKYPSNNAIQSIILLTKISNERFEVKKSKIPLITKHSCKVSITRIISSITKKLYDMNITKSRKQIIILYSSTIIGVLIGVLVSILNTNFLSPSDYGDVRYVNNFIAFFSGILLLGYFVSGSRLLAIAKDINQARQMKGTLIIILGITIFVMMAIFFFCALFHNFILNKSFYYLFYISIPVCGSSLLLNYVNTTSQGDNSIYSIAAARIMPQLLYLATAFIVYKYSGASREKMLLLQNGVYSLVLLFIILYNNPSFKNIRNSFAQLQEENKKYGFQVYCGSLMNVSVQYIAGITLGLFSDNNTNVGFYLLALTLTTPLAMLPNVIGTTYFKEFAHQSKINRKIQFNTIIMSIVSLIGFVIIIYPIVDFLYSPSYKTVALYASFLALASTFQGLGDVYNRFLGAHGKGKYLRNAALFSGIVSIVGYTVIAYFFDIKGAIFTRISGSFIYFALMLYYYRVFTRKSKTE